MRHSHSPHFTCVWLKSLWQNIYHVVQSYLFYFITTRNEVGARLGFYMSVILFTEGSEKDTTPQSRHPPGAGTPPPQEQTNNQLHVKSTLNSQLFVKSH